MSIVKTDVLVVGGSLAGMAAALRIKEKYPETEVTIVEKYTAGYAGKANRGAGIIVTLGDSKPEDF
ncbi:MAG: FAD-binding protein, partial [Oscillospiraceae bacterium]|nr:FAD-binding protein [Oscillospiraceae bacterium]